jgi:hypothetical protein
MVTTHDLQGLEQAGRFEEARNKALQCLKSPENAERVSGALFLIANMKFDVFAEALAAIKPLAPQLAGDFQACNLIAYAAWFNGDGDLCRWASHRCMALNPAASSGYLRLGMHELINQRFADAFCVLSAGLLHCPKEIPAFQAWYKLAKALTQGITSVQFACDDLQVTFRLATFNGHAMETACRHISGHFCEEEELKYVRQFVGRCDAVAEVGAAVGNHTVFFAKALTPKTINVFDANGPAVDQIRDNAALNCSTPGSPQVTVHHAAVGAKTGRIQIFGQDVAVVRLDDALKHKIDFLKIDVDGMEMEVLEGCRGVIARDRPKAMIEVQSELKERFRAFIHEYDYVVEHEIVRPADTNYFIRPRAL